MNKILSFLVAALLATTSFSQVIMDENFDYGVSTGDLEIISGGVWTWHSGNTSFPVNYLSTSLSMTNYPSSGVGGSVGMTASNSEDENRTFTPQTSGFLYYGALMNLSSAATGGYFMHLMTGTSSFNARLYAMDNGSNQFNMGVSSGATGTYGATNFDYNTTYLVVVKSEVTTGNLSLYVLSSVPATEPAVAEVSTTGTPTSSSNAIAFRQSTGNPEVIIDGLRIAGTWADLVTSSGSTELRFTSVAASGCTQPNKPFAAEVCATNAAGSIDASFAGDITVAKAVGSGTLTGTTTQAAVNGCATFTDLKVDAADVYQLTATTSGLTDGTSDNFSVIIDCPSNLDTLKVVSYNLLFFSGGETFCGGTTTVPNRQDSLRKILGFIKPDVFMVCEIQDQNSANLILSDALNVFGETKYKASSYIANTSPSGPGLENMFYYNSHKLTLYEHDVIQTDLRDIGVYKCYGNDPDLLIHEDTTFIFFYMSHLKAGSSSSDSIQRNVEAQYIRDYIDTQKPGINHVFGGDQNLNTSEEQSYKILTQQGTYPLNDPINMPGDWSNNASFAAIHTQSTRAVGESMDCGATGGVDDRLDIMLVSDNVMNGADSVHYIPGTYKAVGNDGNHFNLSINDGVNTSAPDSVINALYYTSDHLPVYMELAISYPTAGGLQITKNITNVSCNGQLDGIVSLTVAGGTTPYVYSWSNTGADVASQSGLAAGNYLVTITDALSVTATAGVVITEPNVLSVTLSATDGCADNDASISTSVMGGTAPYSYVWITGATTSSTAITSNGSYDVTVTDNNGCSANPSISATDFVGLMFGNVTTTDVSCFGQSDGDAVVVFTTGDMPYTYQWSNGMTSDNVGGLVAGNYTVTSTDVHSCVANATVTINQPNILTVGAIVTNASSASASDGSITLTVSGGTPSYNYVWNVGNTTQNIFGLGVGSYQVTVTDANSCVAEKLITIIDQSACNVSVSMSFTEPACGGLSDGTVSANATGGAMPYNYLWNNGMTEQTLTGISTGQYSVTVTEAGLCTTSSSVSVTEPSTMASEAGIGDSIAVCSSEFVVNLMDYVSGNSASDGNWTDVDASGAMIAGVFSPGFVTPGSYHFNYVLSGGGTCPDDSTQVTVFVVGQPNAGTDDIALACEVSTSISLAEGIGPHDMDGVWKDQDATGALTDSIFDPSAAGLGTYDVIYVVTDPLMVCANDTAFVIVNIISSPNAGTSAGADLCTDQFAVNPFDYLGGTPDVGGTWTDVDGSGAFLLGNFSPTVAGAGMYRFEYLVSALGCTDASATVTFSVYGAPNAGGSTNIQACEGTVLLIDSLAGIPDAGGVWTDDDNSGALSNGVVDVAGLTIGNSYNYTYTVSGTSPCTDATATITLDKVVCNSIDEKSVLGVSLFPNPTTGQLILEVGDGTTMNVEITNVLGEIVMKHVLQQHRTVLDISSLNNGTYFVKISNDESQQVLPIVVKK